MRIRKCDLGWLSSLSGKSYRSDSSGLTVLETSTDFGAGGATRMWSRKPKRRVVLVLLPYQSISTTQPLTTWDFVGLSRFFSLSKGRVQGMVIVICRVKMGAVGVSPFGECLVADSARYSI